MKYIKLIMAAVLLVCLLPLPYGYYELVRFLAMGYFAYLAYTCYMKEGKATPMVFVFGALALLFQPFLAVSLGRIVWGIVDVAVAALLVFLWIKERKEMK